MSRAFFSDELPHLLAAADFAVARSGAGSVWERAATATPTLFIPLRGATRGDQVLNARVAEKAGFGLTLPKDADSSDFMGLLRSTLSDNRTLEQMKAAAGDFPARGAADTIVKILKESV